MALSRREGKKTLYNGMPRCSFYLGFVLYAMEGVLRFRCWCELQEEMLRLRCNLQPTVRCSEDLSKLPVSGPTR
jgi:hypothetical protein